MPEARKPRTRSSTRKVKEVEIEQKKEENVLHEKATKIDVQTSTTSYEIPQWTSWVFWLGTLWFFIQADPISIIILGLLGMLIRYTINKWIENNGVIFKK